MISNGCDLFHLSNILGHSNLMTTTIRLHVNSGAKRTALEEGCRGSDAFYLSFCFNISRLNEIGITQKVNVDEMKRKIVDDALMAIVISSFALIVGILVILVNDMLRTPP
jgi:hypothetical protein